MDWEVAKLLKRMVDLDGFEPSTSSMPWKRAPNCATGPLCDLFFRIARTTEPLESVLLTLARLSSGVREFAR